MTPREVPLVDVDELVVPGGGSAHIGLGVNLGTAWRWLACAWCGRMRSHRVALRLFEGWLIVCAHRKTCAEASR